jgi:hypothetical protein
MNAASRFLTALIIAAGAFSLAASAQSPQTPRAGPIAIQQCFVTVPKHMSQKASGTQIMYVNNAKQPASKVTFAVAYRNSSGNFLRRVTDVGTFAPGVTVDHHFDLYNDVTFGGKTAHCSVVAVVFANGHVWHM